MDNLPVLWVCGASGAGKSVAAWTLFEELAAEGVRAAYVDIDQLGMLYPAHDDDPERLLLKSEALAALLPGYAVAGAQLLVVSGVIDPQSGPDTALAGSDLTLCLLAPDPTTLRERILARGWGEEAAVDAVSEATALRHATFVDAVVETVGMSVADTVKRLLSFVRIGDPVTSTPPSVVRSPADIGVVIVTGPRSAGSSTVGFGLAMARWRQGIRTGFVDLQQLSFLAGPGLPSDATAALGTSQLARMHELMATRGANSLVVAGHLSLAHRAAARNAFPSALVTIVRLHADRQTLEAHVRNRVGGSDARLAGDDLLAATPAHQAAVVAAALAEQAHLDSSSANDVVIDVTGRTAGDVIVELERIVASPTE